ncbi:hypothetical protein RND81_12G186300 [Saponaria officinalis]|uniref:Uncharacterized protein n=1 Tax=Saponaria officinalis TaxID=3572 RepID=A0AAW1HCE9_SAPOF
MDQPSVQSTSPVEQDEWDTEGYVIPSLGIESPDRSNFDALKVEDSKTSSVKDTLENIYLGPHGAPPQPKQPEPNCSTNRKQRFKQKLKEADRRTSSSSGRENKVETLRELIGGSGKVKGKMSKGSAKEWLDPHCDESLFDRWNTQ